MTWVKADRRTPDLSSPELKKAPMTALQWTDDFALGVPQMDATHQEFVALLADVDSAADATLLVRWQALVDHTKLAAFGGCLHTAYLPQMGTPGIDRGRRVKTQGKTAFKYCSGRRGGLDMKYIKFVVPDSQVPGRACVRGILFKRPGQLIQLVGNVLAHIRALGHDFSFSQARAECQRGLLIVTKTGHLHRFGGARSVRGGCAAHF